jgi:hypothetical protein
MRVLALIFALIGAAGSGLMGFILLDAVQKKEAELQRAGADGARVQAAMDQIKEYRNLKLAIYGMIAGVPLGVIGGYLAISRKGKFAAALLLLSYAVPFGILAAGVGIDLSDERVKPILLFPAGFLLAALCALFVRPVTPYKRPRPAPGISEDDDMVG